MDTPGHDDERDEQQVGALLRRNDATVRVMGEQLPLTLGVERAARLLGVGRSSMYAAVKRGDIETMRLNGRTVVLTVPLLQRVGVPID